MSTGTVARRGDGPTDLTFENATIIFRNFSGKEGQYNREGDRNFALLIDNDVAIQMKEDGWNIKYLKPREEGEVPQAYLPCAVEFKKGRPPRVVLITVKKDELARTDIPEDLVNILDWVEIANVDLIITPYRWSVRENTGIKAYVKSIYISIVQDRLEQKYAEVPELPLSAQNSLPATIEQLEIEAGQDPNIIDAEIVED